MRASQTNAVGEDPADQEEDELADGGVVGGEVAAVEQRQAGHQGAGGADDDLDRGTGAGPAGLDPQPHGGLVPGRRGQRAQQLPEPLGLVLGRQDRAATTRSQVGSATSSAKARSAGARRSPSRRTAKVATSARIGSGARGAVATMACSRPAEPAMVSRSISAHPATASMRPTAALVPPVRRPTGPARPNRPGRPARRPPANRWPPRPRRRRRRPDRGAGWPAPPCVGRAGESGGGSSTPRQPADDQHQPETEPGPAQGRQGAHVSHQPWGRSSRPGSKPTAASWSRVSLRNGAPGTARPSGPGRKISLETTIGPSASTTSRTEAT